MRRISVARPEQHVLDGTEPKITELGIPTGAATTSAANAGDGLDPYVDENGDDLGDVESVLREQTFTCI